MYKSLVGALLTITILICSFGYLVYVLYLWGADLIVPKIVTGNLFRSEGKTLFLESSPFYFNFEAFD
jgi:hypothetical protein